MYNVKWVCRDERNGVPFIRSRTANILLAEKTTNRMFVVRKKGNISKYSNTPSIYESAVKTLYYERKINFKMKKIYKSRKVV